MFRNNLKIAFRNLRKHKGISFINIFGLAIGMACCLLILLFVKDETSYDRFNRDADRIVRVVKDFVNDDGSRLPDATTYSFYDRKKDKRNRQQEDDRCSSNINRINHHQFPGHKSSFCQPGKKFEDGVV